MSKILDATCTLGVVKVEDLPVDAAVISEGAGESRGVVLLEGDKATYLTSNASDIKDLIDAIGALVDKIVTVATGLDAVTLSPGGQTANILLITVAKTQLLAMKETLK